MTLLKHGQLSTHFYLKEFDFVEPENILLLLLENLRKELGDIKLDITSGPRTINHHINIYKNLEKEDKLEEGKKWHQVIPWGSRHLPAFNKRLRAVDCKVAKEKTEDGYTYHSGKVICDTATEISKRMGIYLGLGEGKFFAHIDVDRVSTVRWGYSY
tara:strand:+ start:572 stop:1042 length:471 start_codon:yes stop_codon:yes gene_type:complete